MDLIRHVVVFDAADVASESAFWAGMLDGTVVDEDPQFHCVIDGQGNWLVGVQHAPDHVPPDWPDGEPQQVHVDFKFWTLGQDDIPQQDNQALDRISPDTPIWTRSEGNDLRLAYGTVASTGGENALLIRADTPRQITAIGHE